MPRGGSSGTVPASSSSLEPAGSGPVAEAHLAGHVRHVSCGKRIYRNTSMFVYVAVLLEILGLYSYAK